MSKGSVLRAKEKLSPKQETQIYSVHGLLAALKSCGIARDLTWGRRIHANAVKSRKEKNIYVVNSLINMYGKCCSMIQARMMFDSIQKPDVIAWTALLLGYVNNGDGLVALKMFSNMKACGCRPDSVTYVAALKACTTLVVNGDGSNCLQWGREIHSQIGCFLDHYVQNMLIDMYAKCGSMEDARAVFESVPNPDVVSWNAVLFGYADNGEGLVALEIFARMKASGCKPNCITYLAALKACTSLAANVDGTGKRECLQWGREIHSQISYPLEVYLHNTLVDMYAKCGSMEEARAVFDSVKNPDVASWNALLLGYADNGGGQLALEMFSRMKACGYEPSSVTYLAVLKACTSLDASRKEECLKLGREIHTKIGFHLNHKIQNTLINMFSRCGSMAEALIVFQSIPNPNLISWTVMIQGYADNGEGYIALQMFSRMKMCGCTPDFVTYVSALKACISLAVNEYGHDCLKWGREIHSEIGCHLDHHHVHSTLIEMYVKCGSMMEAQAVFDSIQNPDVVSWNTLLLGYAENGEGLSVLEMLSRMKARACTPSSVTYIAALKACALVGGLALGRKFHLEINKVDVDACLLTCIVDFYAKCGSMVEARAVFDLHSKKRNALTWTVLLAGYGSLGDTDSVFKLVDTMQDEGFRPDAVTFVCILLCCNHGGLVGKGKEYFEAMTVQYGVTPTVKHYNCMVDILGRANQLNEAIAMIRKMSCNTNAVTWITLLGACRKWKNVKIAKLAFQSLLDIDRKDASTYVVMAHLYGSVCMWEEQEWVLKMRTQVCE